MKKRSKCTSVCKSSRFPSSLGAPDFPEVRVPQRRLRGDALVGVVGEHLVEQGQCRRRAAWDQPGDAAALLRREVEMHGSRPAGEREESARFLKRASDRDRVGTVWGPCGDRRTHCLNFWRTLWSGVPSTSWILDTWSSSLAPGKRGFKLQLEDEKEEVSAVTEPFTPLSVNGCWARWDSRTHALQLWAFCSFLVFQQSVCRGFSL